MERLRNSKLKYWKLQVLLGILFIDILLAIFIMGLNGYTWENAGDRIVGKGFKEIRQGRIGCGSPTRSGNKLALEKLMPGDIVLGGNRGATYGGFTHAAIYEGEGWAWQGWLSLGISRVRVSYFLTYDRAAILRVKVPPENRSRAVEKIKKLDGQLFYPLAFKPGNRIWNCTKAVWKSYYDLGSDLDSAGDLWVTPDSMYRSPKVEIIAEDGERW